MAAPARAQLLWLDLSLAPPKVEYSADVTIATDDETIEGKVKRAPDKERSELTVKGDSVVRIIRLDRKLVWSLSPEDKLYLESSLDEALGRQPGNEGKPHHQLTLTPDGSETIDGLHTTKQTVRGKNDDGSPMEGDVWVSDDGIVLRVDSVVVDENGDRHSIRMELHNLRVAPQDPRLFEIPAGYKRASQDELGAAGGVGASGLSIP
jgi:hypothetical protein